MVALIGASGSGKSTLIRTIAGLTPADSNAGAGGKQPLIYLGHRSPPSICADCSSER